MVLKILTINVRRVLVGIIFFIFLFVTTPNVASADTCQGEPIKTGEFNQKISETLHEGEVSLTIPNIFEGKGCCVRVKKSASETIEPQGGCDPGEEYNITVFAPDRRMIYDSPQIPCEGGYTLTEDIDIEIPGEPEKFNVTISSNIQKEEEQVTIRPRGGYELYRAN